jgi:hypothetical protein
LIRTKTKQNINQIANLTFLEFEDNIEISDDTPSEYFAMIKKRFSESELNEMLAQHAIPENFINLNMINSLKKEENSWRELSERHLIKYNYGKYF